MRKSSIVVDLHLQQPQSAVATISWTNRSPKTQEMEPPLSEAVHVRSIASTYQQVRDMETVARRSPFPKNVGTPNSVYGHIVREVTR